MEPRIREWRLILEDLLKGKSWFEQSGKIGQGFEVLDSPTGTKILFAPDGLIIGCVNK